jgi:amidase
MNVKQPTELWQLDAGEIVSSIVDRRTSAAEVIEACCARLEATNPTINAICTLNDGAGDEARAIDRRLASGAPARALEGVPVVVKDVIDTAGIRTTYGTRALADNVPTQDALLVERLRLAGAIILGKTNTPEYATDINTTNELFGQTRNPWDVNTTAGGSSGGTGAAIAAGIAPLGVGTDLGGSIRIPAAFNGILGLRPSPGTVAVYPRPYAWDTLVAHVQGPMGRSARDLALMMSVISGSDDHDPLSLPIDASRMLSDFEDPRAAEDVAIAYAGDLNGFVPVAREVNGLARQAFGRFADLGYSLAEASFDVSDLPTIIAGTRGFTVTAHYGEIYRERGNELSVQLRNQVESAAKISVDDIVRAERARTAYWHRVREFMRLYPFVVTPTVGCAAFRLDEPLPSEIDGEPVARYYDVLLTTYAFSVLGLPAMSIPCGFTAAGLPVGLQVIGRKNREADLMKLAHRYAAMHPEPMIAEPDPSTLRPVALSFATGGVPIGQD